MSYRTTSFVSLQRWAASFAGMLLLSSAAPAQAQEGRRPTRSSHARACEAPKKSKASAGRGRKADKGKSSSESSTPSSSSPSSSQNSDDTDDLGGLDDVAPAPKRAEPAPAPAKPAREEPAAESESHDDSGSADSDAADASESDAEASGSGVEPAPESTSAEAEGGPSVTIDAYAGFGIATRSVHMPGTLMKGGVLNITPGVTPAAEVGLRVTSHPDAAFSFYVNLVYQSALGFAVTEHPPLALPKEVRARSERVALEVAPRWHLASSKLDIAVPLGATVRTLWAEVHTSETPSFSLVGPHLRLEASFAFTEMLSLRLSPELHYIMMVDQDLRTAGVSSSGPAIGGEVSVAARLSQAWSIGVNYRESHAFLSPARGDVSFRDIERYLTLRGTGSF